MCAQTGSAMPETGAQHIRRITSFRSRRSSLTEAQQEIWDRLWPSLGRLAIPAGTADGAGPPEPLDITAWFGREHLAGGQERSDTGRPPGGQERSDTGRPPGGQERSDTGRPPGGQERSDTGRPPGGQERSDTGRPPGGQERSDTGRPLVCEIGCGTGTSTLAMARDEPDVDVIAVEVYRRGLAQLLSAIDRASEDDRPVTNIRLIRGDAVDVLEHLLPPESLTGARVFFPDPWPKSRHHKRRLLQPGTVRLIAERLRPGGVLHAATDDAGYAVQIAEAGDAEPLLRRVAPGEALPISVQRPTTKYETKAHAAGSAVTELIWMRRG